MLSIYEVLSAPGSRKPVTRAAATQLNELGIVKGAGPENTPNLSAYTVIDEEKPRLLDRWLDVIVAPSGSIPALLITTTVILIWAFMGIRYGNRRTGKLLHPTSRPFSTIFSILSW